MDGGTTMPTPACECNCASCAATNCAACAHDDGTVCDCAGCTCNMDKPTTDAPMAM